MTERKCINHRTEIQS